MALLFCDGFDSYGNVNDLFNKWQGMYYANGIDDTDNYYTTGVDFSPNGGRFGLTPGGAMNVQCASGPVFALITATNELFFNFSFRLRIARGNTATFVGFKDLSDSSPQSASGPELYKQVDGTINYRGYNSQDLGNGTQEVKYYPDWNYISGHIKLHDTTGRMHVYLNGVEDINFTGETVTNNLKTVNAIQFLGTGEAKEFIAIDDLLVYDTTGSYMNSLITNDVQVVTLRPTGDNGTQQFICSAGSTHYALVDETVPDGTDFLIGTATAGHRDVFDLQNLARSSSLRVAMVPQAVARISSGEAGNLKLLIKSSSALDVSANKALTERRKTYQHAVYLDPGTTAAWGDSGITSALMGVQVGT